MLLEKLWRKLGMMTPTEDEPVIHELEAHRAAAEEAQRAGQEQLDQIREIRRESQQPHSMLKKIREENHLADLMRRAMMGAR